MARTPYPTLTVCTLLATAVVFGPAARGSAELENECRNEARLYEIPQEQLADYVAGCLASRGGTLEMEPVVEEIPEQPLDDSEASGSETQGDPSTETVEQ